jgi:hypothetical protein
MEPGEYVVDTDDDDPDLAVVVADREASIDEVTVSDPDSDRTVAADNPDYDPSTPAITVAFVESGLNRQWPDWTDAPPSELHAGATENGVKLYTFPAARLRTLTGQQAAVMLAEETVDLTALQTRLEEAGWSVEPDDQLITVKKHDEQYRIYKTGDVDGTGQLRTPLTNLVDEYSE